MTPEKHKRIKEVFLAACELKRPQRDELIDRECDDDAEMRAAVERMLAHDDDPQQLEDGSAMRQRLEGLFQEASSTPTDGRALKKEHPERIGKYRLVELLGEGGFGTVFKAEQSEPVRRTVAIKVIKRGMDTKQVIARFAAERQALAMMDHPGVARIFDAEETESGRPYFVMEWIPGIPITRYCDQKKLSPRERLGLFTQVCGAVQYAHQKGIIHRDIKPSNILVVDEATSPSSPLNKNAGRATPKIIDFGIAKAMDETLGGLTLFTEQGQMIGTPDYMSPEQAAGKRDIDTRSDIYSLGVLLYELMTGATPLDCAGASERGVAGVAQLQRMVCETDPPTPSTRLRLLGEKAHTVATERRMDPVALRRLLRGDLDWIIMKALEKNRERRYESANNLAADIENYLNDQPVSARPPTVGYRFTKFARRNKVSLVAGSAVALALMAGAVVAGVGWVKSIKSENRAVAEASIARAVNEFLNNDLLAAASPDQLGNEVQLRKAVEVAADRLEGKFADQPEVEAAIRLTLGRTFRKLADLDRAQQHLERSREIRQRVLGSGSPAALEVAHELGHVFAQKDQNIKAEGFFREAYEGRKRLWGSRNSDTISSLYELSVAIGEQGRYAETERLMLEALDLARRHLGDSDPLTIVIIRGTGVLYSSQDQFDKAGPYYEEAYHLARSRLGLEHPTTLLLMTSMANHRRHQGRLEESEKLLSEAWTISKHLRGEQHPANLIIMNNLALVKFRTNRAEEAEKLLHSALDMALNTMPAGHSVVFNIQSCLAGMYDTLKQFDKAEPHWLAIVAYEDKYGTGHPEMQKGIGGLVTHYELSGETEKASIWKAKLGQVGPIEHTP